MDHKMIRRAQTMSPFGVGAVMDIDGESLVAADITYWKGNGEEIREPRLEKYLAVRKFLMAVPAPDFQTEITKATPGVPFVRFPVWLFCPNCRNMFRRYSRIDAPVCSRCAGNIKLTPMRFVMACPRGHLSDVPWDKWAHSFRKEGRCEDPKLVFRTEPGGSGLDFVFVECLTCKAKRPLSGLVSQDSLKQLNVKCPGHHPWTPWSERDQHCDAIPQVLQRGATNLTFSITESSIDIPPHSSWNTYSQETLIITNHGLFQTIRTSYDPGQKEQDEFFQSLIDRLATVTKISPAIVKATAMRELGESESGLTPQWNPDDLLIEEFNALSAKGGEYDPRDRFIKKDVSLENYPDASASEDYKTTVALLRESLGGLVQVSRLREVRALRGFSRLGPPEMMENSDEDPAGHFSLYSNKKIPPQLVLADLDRLARTEKWLPAVEVFGEGLFVRLDEDRLQQWEANVSVVRRAGDLLERRNKNAPYLPEPSPRLILLHTLSHILIRQLSFDCGYSIAALRERIYARSPLESMAPAAGILIYTAAGDSEGTLGGLVRQGEAGRMLPTILKAIQSAEWCSSDPLCRESKGQGLFAMNLAACHACSLLPETSCTMSNRMLDRIMLLGSNEGAIPGYFSPLIRHLISVKP